MQQCLLLQQRGDAKSYPELTCSLCRFSRWRIVQPLLPKVSVQRTHTVCQLRFPTAFRARTWRHARAQGHNVPRVIIKERGRHPPAEGYFEVKRLG